jgi:hypothetical protein
MQLDDHDVGQEIANATRVDIHASWKGLSVAQLSPIAVQPQNFT